MPRISPTLWRTSDGDMLDAIAAKVYGLGNAGLDALLDANPHLADTPVLAGGVEVRLPVVERPARGAMTAVLKVFS